MEDHLFGANGEVLGGWDGLGDADEGGVVEFCGSTVEGPQFLGIDGLFRSLLFDHANEVEEGSKTRMRGCWGMGQHYQVLLVAVDWNQGGGISLVVIRFTVTSIFESS